MFLAETTNSVQPFRLVLFAPEAMFHRQTQSLEANQMAHKVRLWLDNDEPMYHTYREWLQNRNKSVQVTALEAAIFCFELFPKGIPEMTHVAQMAFVNWQHVADFFNEEYADMCKTTREDLPF